VCVCMCGVCVCVCVAGVDDVWRSGADARKLLVMYSKYLRANVTNILEMVIELRRNFI
jgi:hypothetical protein